MKIYIKYIILYFILFKIYQHSWCIQASSDQPTGMRKLPKVKEVKAEFKHNTYKNKYITLTKNKYTSQLTKIKLQVAGCYGGIILNTQI